MTPARKANARRQPGDSGTTQAIAGSGNGRMGRPEFQGKSGNARHTGQRPPHWRKPTGADGMAMLEALFGPPTLPADRRGRK
jgi:hypothetical protein